MFLAVATTAVHASRTMRPGLICVHDRLNSYLEQSFIRGLRGIGFNSDPFAGLESYALVHCGAAQQVTIERTKDSADLGRAEELIVYMIANDQEETFEDVVRNLKFHKFEARIDRVPEDACYCREVN